MHDPTPPHLTPPHPTHIQQLQMDFSPVNLPVNMNELLKHVQYV